MARIQIPLGKGSYESVSKPYAAQRCINLYAVVPQAEALNDQALFGTPGLVEFGNVGDYSSRGAHVMGGVYYNVSGTTLYSLDAVGVSTSLGTITGTARVSMADDGTKLSIVVPGGDAYEWNATTTTLTPVTDLDYQPADVVRFIDGYFVYAATSGDNFFSSGLNDPLTFSALDFGTSESSPDAITGLHVNHNELHVLGDDTIEVFENIGGADFPFQRIPGAIIQKGCRAKYSPITFQMGNSSTFFFIGGGVNEKNAIWMVAGSSQAQKVSTDAIDQEIQEYTDAEIAEAFSFAYSLQGADFCGFTFNSINHPSKTFVYNGTASKLSGQSVWGELQTGAEDNSWRAASVSTVYSKLICSDSLGGKIGYLDPGTYTEYGEPIIRSKVTGPFASNGTPMFVSEIELTCESGVGVSSGQGSNPLVIMDYSDDGARTWSDKKTRPIGKIGEYIKRAEWRRLGRIPAHRVFRFSISDPVKVAFIKLEADVT